MWADSLLYAKEKHLSPSSNPAERKTQLLATLPIPFEKLTPIHPNRRITLETGPTPIALRLIDLFVPVGFGQHALLFKDSPNGSRTNILHQIANLLYRSKAEEVSSCKVRVSCIGNIDINLYIYYTYIRYMLTE
jgi:hypothetical protein